MLTIAVGVLLGLIAFITIPIWFPILIRLGAIFLMLIAGAGVFIVGALVWKYWLAPGLNTPLLAPEDADLLFEIFRGAVGVGIILVVAYAAIQILLAGVRWCRDLWREMAIEPREALNPVDPDYLDWANREGRYADVARDERA